MRKSTVYNIAMMSVIIVFFVFRFPIYRTLRGAGIPDAVVSWSVWAVQMIILGIIYKRAILTSMPDSLQFSPVNPYDFPWRDDVRLGMWTAELEEYGFKRLTDYTASSPALPNMTGFARLLFHPIHGCFAEINQLRVGQGIPIPIACVIMSTMEDDWALSTTTRIPNGTNWVIRRPRSVWTSHPNLSPGQLTQEHLQFRREMEQNLGVQTLSDLSLEAYYESERKCTAEQKAIMRRKPLVVILAEIALFSRHPKTEWLGGYPAQSKKRMRE